MADTIARNQPEFAAVLQKHCTGCLLRVNADTVVSDNSTAGWGHFKLLNAVRYIRYKVLYASINLLLQQRTSIRL
jgi:hypothetical protein